MRVSRSDREPLIAILTITAVTWGVTTGGTSSIDLLIGVILLTLAMSMSIDTACRGHGMAPTFALALALLLVGFVHDGLGISAVPIPGLLAIAFAAYTVGSVASPEVRAHTLDGLIAVGLLQAFVTIVVVVLERGGLDGPRLFEPFRGLEGSPNAFAAFLLATTILTSRHLSPTDSDTGHSGATRTPRFWRAAFGVQSVAIVMTGSRFAILLLGGILAVGAIREPVRRRKIEMGSVGLLTVLAVSVAIASRRNGRLDLWRSALHRIREAPWIGHGSETPVLRGATPATPFAHNEILQLAIQFGIPLTITLIFTVIWVLRRSGSVNDRDLVSAAGVIVASGLVDVTLRSTPVVIVAAVAAGAAKPSAPPDDGCDYSRVTAQTLRPRPVVTGGR